MSTATATHPLLFPPGEDFAAHAHVDSKGQYQAMYNRSVNDPDGFWAELAENFYWKARWSKVREFDFSDKISIKYFLGAKTNISYNCLDRHLAKRGDQTAFIWESNQPGEDAKVTYRELHRQVCKFASALKSLGVEKGDRVCLYMQMIPQLSVAMLACARIGAVHSVVFGAFSEDSLRDRIQDSACKILVTQDTALRGPKNNIPMKTKGDKAVAQCPSIEKVIVVKRTGCEVPMQDGRDVWWDDLVVGADPNCECEWLGGQQMPSPQPILYS